MKSALVHQVPPLDCRVVHGIVAGEVQGCEPRFNSQASLKTLTCGLQVPKTRGHFAKTIVLTTRRNIGSTHSYIYI